MLTHLLYTSRSLIPVAEQDAAIEVMVTAARLRNKAENISGCLLYSAGWFAQILEGAEERLNRVVESILRDPRHTDITILEQGRVPRRRFEGWELGYAGPALLVQRSIITPGLAALNNSKIGVAELIATMESFRSDEVVGMMRAMARLGSSRNDN
jgi:hypothetical protein